MKISTIYRYIFKELALTFLLSITFLNSILTVSSLFNLSKEFLNFGISFMDFFMLIILLQPQLLVLTIPIALLLSILIAYGRLNMDNEIIVLRTSGMSLVTIARAVFTLGVICFSLSLVISLYIGPLSVSKLKRSITDIIAARLSMSLREGMFNTVFKDIVIMPQKRTSENGFSEVFIYDGHKPEPMVIWADRATIVPQEENNTVNINMEKGELYITKGSSVTEIFFDKYSLYLRPELTGTSKNIRELPIKDLIRRAEKSKELSPKLELHKRFALPMVSLILMLLGPPLFPAAGKTGRLGGLSIGLFVCTVYYLLYIYADNLARGGKIHYIIGGWGPTVLLGLCAMAAFYKMSRK